MSIVLDKELEHLRGYEKDSDYFDDIYDELYQKYLNEFVAIKNQKVFHNKDLDALLEILKGNHIDPSHTFIQFIRDRNNRYL